MPVRDRPPIPLLAQAQHLLQDDPAEVPLRPAPQRSETLPEAPAVGCPVRLPDPTGDLGKLLLQMLTTLADLEVSVQEALEDDHPAEQGLPGRLGPLPAVGVDGPGRVLRGDVEGRALDSFALGEIGR